MGTILIVIVAVIIFFALIFALFSPKNERGQAATVGAVYGVAWLISIIPFVVIITLVVLIVRACS